MTQDIHTTTQTNLEFLLDTLEDMPSREERRVNLQSYLKKRDDDMLHSIGALQTVDFIETIKAIGRYLHISAQAFDVSPVDEEDA